MTILDCCISLKTVKKILVVFGVVDMRQLLLSIEIAHCITYIQKPWIMRFIRHKRVHSVSQGKDGRRGRMKA